jgi:hypothetical protein
MRSRSFPLLIAAIGMALAAGWVVASQVRAADATQQQRIARLNERSAEQKMFATYVLKQLSGSEEIWDEVGAARMRAQAAAEERSACALGSDGLACRIGVLHREQALVDQVDAFAVDASAQEAETLDRFSDRYGAASVATARQDLAEALQDVHDETRHWTQALRDASDPRNGDGVTASGTKSEFEAAVTARAKSAAALDRLSSDWTEVVQNLKQEANDTRLALSKA